MTGASSTSASASASSVGRDNERWGRPVVRWIIVALAAVLLEQAETLFLHRDRSFGTLLLAPGCLLPFFIWWGFRYASAAFCGAAAAMLFSPELRMTSAPALLRIPAMAAGLVIELGWTVWLLRRWNFRDDLSRGHDALLLVYAACLGTVVSGWLVMPLVFWSDAETWGQLLMMCGTWWLMHFVSIVVFAPTWLIWRRWSTTTEQEWMILGAMTAGLALLESIDFHLWNFAPSFQASVFFASLPLVVWGV